MQRYPSTTNHTLLTMSKFNHPVAEATDSSPFGSLSPPEFYARHSVQHGSEYITTNHNLKLFTQWWAPLQQSAPLNGVVCVVHGFTGESSWFVQLTAVHIAKHGFAVCAIDHTGHGYSEGLPAHVPDINPVVDQCVLFFDGFRARYAPDLPAFLYAESLGGAIALLITLRRVGEGIVPKKRFDGVVLNGAMCGISDKFKPQWPLEHFLSIAAYLIPTWCVVPTRGSLVNVSFKVEWKRKLALASPKRPVLRPRAATAQELLRVCREVQEKFSRVDVPFLVVHGGDDTVCDPACVEDLYNRAVSKDKTLRIYPGMWHQMVGEPDENVELVFGEVVEWLLTRTEAGRSSTGKVDV